MSRPTQQFTLK